MAAFPFGMHGTPSLTSPEEPFMAVDGVAVAFKAHATNRIRKYVSGYVLVYIRVEGSCKHSSVLRVGLRRKRERGWRGEERG